MSYPLRLRTLLTALAALAVVLAALTVVTAVDRAAQAAGKATPVKAGKTTKTTKLTTLRRTKKGAALRLRTKASSPPLMVSSSKRVARLNADQVDGRDAGDLVTSSYAYQLPSGGTPAGTQSALFPELPAGSYLVTYAVALQGTAAISTAQCYLRQADVPSPVIGLAYATLKGTYATSSSSGRIDTANGTVELVCSASTTFVFDSTDAGGSVVFTRTDVDERLATAPEATRPSAPRSGSVAGTASGR